MSECISYGWGSGPWGIMPWGMGGSFVPGGPLPVLDPFDIYCVGPCGAMSAILTYLDVALEGDGTHAATAVTGDLVLSGGVPDNNPVWLFIDPAVPGQSTLEATVKFDRLPISFADVEDAYILLGLTDSTGAASGFFFSQVGIAFSGCFRPDGYYNLVLDAPLQLLSDSAGILNEGEYFTIRLVTDFDQGLLYLYITRTLELPAIGHQLRFVLPAFPSSSCPVTPPDRTTVSVRGTAGTPTQFSLASICLGTGLIIPNIPPVADAGKDQAIQTCAIALLDGSRSFDPEGQTVTYLWRLIDAPQSSTFGVSEYDGNTRELTPHGPPAQLTNRFYSEALGETHATTGQAIESGDVLVVEGTPYTITGTGLDAGDFYLTIDGYELLDDIAASPFHVLRQRYISGTTSQKPTFYPDVPGFYKFDLTVNDGTLNSTPSTTVVNVLESPVPRGCIPDMKFMWDYLSDFWSYVEDVKPRIETVWSAMAQLIAGEMLRIAQFEYSKSLRDIPRTFARKWLPYTPVIEEVIPEATAHRLSLGGTLSSIISSSGVTASGLTLVFTSPFRDSFTFTATGSDPLSAAQLAQQLSARFTASDPNFKVTLSEARDGSGDARIRINAPIPFEIDAMSTLSIFSPGPANSYLRGYGTRLSDHVLKVDEPLGGVDAPEDQLLLINGIAYDIVRFIDDASDVYPYQRVLVTETLATDIISTSWSIPDQTVSLRTDFYLGCVEEDDVAEYEVTLPDGSIVEALCPVLGASEASPTVLAVDLSSIAIAVVLQLGQYRVWLKRVIRRKYIPVDPLLMDVPYLQPRVVMNNDTEVLRRNLDYFIETFRGLSVIRFASTMGDGPDVWERGLPPDMLWAEYSYFDNRPMIEDNFGLAVGVRVQDIDLLPNSVDYLSAVRGVWYVLFNGPTLHNLRVGAQILLGLPFAEEASTITEIRTDFSPTLGRLLLSDVARPEIVRSYTFPKSLGMEVNPETGVPYAVGDTVAQFAPLVEGVEVDDYVKTPDWFAGYLSQGAFFEIEKFFRFLVRVDSAAFSLSSMLYVQTLILRLKPTYTYPLFVVRKAPRDATVSVTDSIGYKVGLYLHDLGVTDGAYGAATMFDEPDPSPTAPDVPVEVTVGLEFEAAALSTIPATGYPFGGGRGVGRDGNLTSISLDINGSPSLSNPDYTIVVYRNGSVLAQQAFTFVGPSQTVNISGTHTVYENDTITTKLVPDPLNTRYPNITDLTLTMDYNYVPLPAATGHLQSRFDAGADPSLGEPTAPDAQPTVWGYDKGLLTPRHAAVGIVSYVAPGSFTPAYDTIFQWDSVVVNGLTAVFYDSFITHCPTGAGGVEVHPSSVEALLTQTADTVVLRIYGGYQDATDDYELVLSVAGVDQTPLAFNLSSTSNQWRVFEFSVSYAITAGDILTARIRHAEAFDTLPWFQKVAIAVGTGLSWSFDDTLPAGTYKQVRAL